MCGHLWAYFGSGCVSVHVVRACIFAYVRPPWRSTSATQYSACVCFYICAAIAAPKCDDNPYVHMHFCICAATARPQESGTAFAHLMCACIFTYVRATLDPKLRSPTLCAAAFLHMCGTRVGTHMSLFVMCACIFTYVRLLLEGTHPIEMRKVAPYRNEPYRNELLVYIYIYIYIYI